jgi:hypothetical protein
MTSKSSSSNKKKNNEIKVTVEENLVSNAQKSQIEAKKNGTNIAKPLSFAASYQDAQTKKMEMQQSQFLRQIEMDNRKLLFEERRFENTLKTEAQKVKSAFITDCLKQGYKLEEIPTLLAMAGLD